MWEAGKPPVAVKPIPEGYDSITPFLTVRGAGRAIDFYSRAFGDEVPGMDSRSPETLGGLPSGITLYVRDVDELFRKAMDAGAAVKRPSEDMFRGGGELIKKLSERK